MSNRFVPKEHKSNNSMGVKYSSECSLHLMQTFREVRDDWSTEERTTAGPFKLLILLLLFLAPSSCTFLSEQSQGLFGPSEASHSVDTATEPGASKNLPSVEDSSSPPYRKVEKSLSDVEVLWQIPKEKVEGFHISYGYSRANLPHHLRILAKDLEQIEDPVHGAVYRYVIGGVPLQKSLFITIAAYTGDKQSRASDVFEVRPAEPDSLQK